MAGQQGVTVAMMACKRAVQAFKDRDGWPWQRETKNAFGLEAAVVQYIYSLYIV